MAKLDDQEEAECFTSIIEKKMCKFCFYIVAKLDDQDDKDEWFYQPH